MNNTQGYDIDFQASNEDFKCHGNNGQTVALVREELCEELYFLLCSV